MNHVSRIAITLLVLSVCCAGEALGCPNCKDALAQNDPVAAGLVQGYFWSILFMLAMPFTIFAGMSAYFYLLVRRARRDAALARAAATAAKIVEPELVSTP